MAVVGRWATGGTFSSSGESALAGAGTVPVGGPGEGSAVSPGSAVPSIGQSPSCRSNPVFVIGGPLWGQSGIWKALCRSVLLEPTSPLPLHLYVPELGPAGLEPPLLLS